MPFSYLHFLKAGVPLLIAQELCRHSLNLSHSKSFKWLETAHYFLKLSGNQDFGEPKTACETNSSVSKLVFVI